MGGFKAVATLWFLGLVICGAHLASAQRRTLSAQRRSEQEILNLILDPSTYDGRINPGGNDTGNGPTVVAVNFYVRSISEIDENSMEVKSQLTLRQQWNDPRLTYTRSNSDENQKFVTIKDTTKVWTPDLFVANENEATLHEFSQSNTFVRVYPNGDVKLSQRVSLTTSCSMNFKLFPFDRQVCSLKFASYAYTNQEIIFKWKSEDPIQVISGLALKNYELEGNTTHECDSETTTGVYSCLRADFTFRRMVSFYLVQVFIPCVMLVIISWLSFWLSPKDIVARLLLVVSTLFVMVMATFRLNERFPQTGYTKAIDVWTGNCLTFIFVVLVETIVVHYLARREAENGGDGGAGKEDGDGGVTEDDVETQALKPDTDEDGEKGAEKKPKKLSNVQKYAKRYWSKIDRKPRSSKTDFVFRIVYPIVFALFALIFFVCAMSSKM